MTKVEILFTAWNRLAFTRVSFALLMANTDWRKVSRLVVYDDGSEDGTREFLEGHVIAELVPAYEVRHGGWHSTGATMNDYLAQTECEAFVKIDNDIAMPPGWLDPLLRVGRKYGEFDLIGCEAGWTGPFKHMRASTHRYHVTPARHIGGVGLMRPAAFHRRRAIPLSLGKNGRAGFTIWQHRQSVRAGWLTPDIAAVQLDRIPDEPWRTLSERYVEEGWARAWDPYLADMEKWWSWVPTDELVAA